jgi:hypothetical protein
VGSFESRATVDKPATIQAIVVSKGFYLKAS